MEALVVTAQESMAEIRWAVHSVSRGLLNSSNSSVGALFKTMLPNSDIAKEMTFGPYKL